MYRDGDEFHFMEMESYEQFHLNAAELDDAVNYMKDGMQLDRISYESETLGVELPITVDLVVVETDPASRATPRPAHASPPRPRPGSSCRCRSS